jgi:hypothetical protein
MNDDRTLERAARSWLEAGPTEAPDHAVETALLRIQTTHQERDIRVPWRVRPMSTTARLAVAAIAIAVVAVGGALILAPGGNSSVGGPTPNPAGSASTTTSAAPSSTPPPSASSSPVPTPAPTLVPVGSLDQTHVSDLYGYSVRYPSNWHLSAGTNPGIPDNLPELSAGRSDFYGDTTPGSGHGLMVTSAPLRSTRTDLTSWSTSIAHQVVSTFGPYLHIGACVQSARTLVLAGEPANEADFICPGATWLFVTAIHGGRAYLVAWLDDGGFDSVSVRALLDKFLETYSFTG